MASNVPAPESPEKRKYAHKTTPLGFMTKVSKLVSFFRPPQTTPNPSAPKLIMLATWMDARESHIAKYMTQYQALYPTSSILLIRSSFTCHLNHRVALKNLKPAVRIIQQELSSTDDESSNDEDNDDLKPQILIHMFSNGGSCMVYHLYNVYAKFMTKMGKMAISGEGNTHSLLPHHICIFDSAPGGWGYDPSTSAVLHSLPSGITRQIAYPFVHLLGAYWYVKYRTLNVAEETVTWGEAHNSEINKHETARVYIYSEADKMVDFRHVEAHIEDAVKKGFVVKGNVKLRDSEHVAHARRYPELYWGTIREAWERKGEVSADGSKASSSL